MDFEYTPAQEAFRKEFRGWLATNLPSELCLDGRLDEKGHVAVGPQQSLPRREQKTGLHHLPSQTTILIDRRNGRR